MKIAIAASEAAPFIKTGGLGDVMQALPLALSRIKHNEVCLFLPYYGAVKSAGWDVEFLGSFEVQMAWRREYVGVMRLKSRRKKLRVYFIDNEHYFCRSRIYGEGDDGERFAYFSKAVLAAIGFVGFRPDVINCNDWQTALIPLLLRTEYHETLGDVRSVFTIHNIEYQGKAGLDFNREVLGLAPECDDLLRFDGCTNFMKAAIVTADRVNTVSETYAGELRYPYYAHGLSGIISDKGEYFSGITNGIDMELFDPSASAGLVSFYDAKSYEAGKRENKLALQRAVGLREDADSALAVMVTRLAGHKGIDLLCYMAERLLERRVQLLVVGTGEEKYEWFLEYLQSRHPEQAAVYLKFDPKIANLAYAGADLYLMPSKSEPCGLSQLIAMRFGTIPVVNATGGLRDTVWPYDPECEAGRGFTFQSYNADDFLAAIDRALALFYNEPEKWKRLIENDMAIDSSWTLPAQSYMELYKKATEG